MQEKTPPKKDLIRTSLYLAKTDYCLNSDVLGIKGVTRNAQETSKELPEWCQGPRRYYSNNVSTSKRKGFYEPKKYKKHPTKAENQKGIPADLFTSEIPDACSRKDTNRMLLADSTYGPAPHGIDAGKSKLTFRWPGKSEGAKEPKITSHIGVWTNC